MAFETDPQQRPEQKQLNRRLIATIRSRDTATALSLLTRGADPNAKDTSSAQTAFLLAVQGVPGTGPAPENLPLIKALIARGADINAGDENNTTALMSVAVNGHMATVRLLLDRGARVNLKDTGYDVAFYKSGRKWNVHIGGRTALQYAQEFDNIAVMRLLLSRAADVNIRDDYGMTLLMNAASYGDTAKMRLLLDFKADVNATDKGGRTALMIAANSAQWDVITLLRQRRAAVNARDAKGETALIHSLDRPRPFDNPRTVRMLLDMGADCRIKSYSGRTALSIALSQRHEESARLLKQAGAKQ